MTYLTPAGQLSAAGKRAIASGEVVLLTKQQLQELIQRECANASYEAQEQALERRADASAAQFEIVIDGYDSECGIVKGTINGSFFKWSREQCEAGEGPYIKGRQGWRDNVKAPLLQAISIYKKGL